MNLEKLNIQPEVLELIKEQAFQSDRDILIFLEQYKYKTREELVQFLDDSYSTCDYVSINTVKQNPKFKNVEMKYNVIVSESDEATVEVIYDQFESKLVDMIELESVFNQYNIVLLCITPVNYIMLSNKSLPKYNPIQVFKRYLFEAVSVGATDIHFDVKHFRDGVKYPVSFRISGDLYEVNLIPIDSELNKHIIGTLISKKTTANELDLLESSGVIASAAHVLGDDVELRISVDSVRDGYHYVIRLQQKTTYAMTIEQLGFDDKVLNVLRRLTKKRSGITLITGAIRTGKNTTAFAMANEMVKEPIKIVSYESPIEVLMPFSQMDYKENQDILLNSIRLAKKQDVNVAFLNEIPNKEVAFAVQDLVNSSVHVITTMHMNRIWHLPYKLKEYYGDEYKDIISQINCVINQKMFPKTCKFCRDMILVDSIQDKTVARYLKDAGFISVNHNHGCQYCNNTGIEPRSNQPYAEFILFTDELISKLLKCDNPAEMEIVLREVVHGNSLEDYMLAGISTGELSYDSLITLV